MHGGAFDWDAKTWAHATIDGTRIGLNPEWYGNPRRLKDSLVWLERKRWHPGGCNSIESIMTHEFGHHVWNWYYSPIYNSKAFTPHVSSHGVGLIHDTIRLWERSNPVRGAISRYAKENREEGWAEGFTALHHGTSAVQQVKRVRTQKELLTLLGSDSQAWLAEGEWQWTADVATEKERELALGVLGGIVKRLALKL